MIYNGQRVRDFFDSSFCSCVRVFSTVERDFFAFKLLVRRTTCDDGNDAVLAN